MLKVLSKLSVHFSLNELLEFAEDMEIDIPKIWNYLGELISPVVRDNVVPLQFLKQACAPLVASNKAGILVAAVLNDASQRLGHADVGEQWKKSGLQWSDFLPSKEDEAEFLKKHVSSYGPLYSSS